MADARKNKAKKPRVRKAPTLREQAEMAKVKSEESQKPKRIRKIATKAASPLRNSSASKNPVLRALRKVGRGIKKVFGWLVPKYFVNAWHEVRQVTWPTRRETWRLTLAVFIFAVIFGAMVAGVDKVLDLIFKKVVLK